MKWDFKLDLKGVNPQKIHDTQKFVDSEILRRSSAYVPHDTGNLEFSGQSKTRIGTGIIRYETPYAKRQYFKGKSSGQRGRKWVKRMWLSQGKQIVKSANKMLSGR
ncbi:MAG: minor capsid protein [Ruminococcus flavefaciens]|nr:minor capsid protein [Ruminococcus flavefaciens]